MVKARTMQRRVFHPPRRTGRVWVVIHLSQDMDGPVVMPVSSMAVAQSMAMAVLKAGMIYPLVNGDWVRAGRPDIIKRVEILTTK